MGRFTYRALPERAFWIGVDRLELEHGGTCLMATPEKALADSLHLARGARLSGRKEMLTYLVDSLRIDEEVLAGLSVEKVEDIAGRFGSRRVPLLARAPALLRGEARDE